MKRSDQSINNNQETSPGAGVSAIPSTGLSFRNMFDRFYMRQGPPDPSDPKFRPPVNLKERGQK